MELWRNERAGEMEYPREKPADQRHRPARFPHAKIQRPGRGLNPVSLESEFSCFQDNYTPLHIAVESAKPAVVETLLGYGADVHVTVWSRAGTQVRAETGDPLENPPTNGIVRHVRRRAKALPPSQGNGVLAEGGGRVSTTASPRCDVVLLAGGKLRETPLHIAARVKDGDKCALMLLKSGAGPNLTTDDGQTPVHVAARNGNVATLVLLLDDGGDPLFKSKVCTPALAFSSPVFRFGFTRHLGLLTFLSGDRNMRINSLIASTRKALNWRAVSPSIARLSVYMLLSISRNVKQNRTEDCSVQPFVSHLFLTRAQLGPNEVKEKTLVPNPEETLFWAFAYFSGQLDPRVFAYCLTCMVSAQNGETPLHLACRGCRADVVRQLIEFVRAKHGSDVVPQYVNSLTEDGASALHYAAQASKADVERPMSDKEVVQLLLENGADVSLITRMFRYVEETCIFKEIVQLLLENGADVSLITRTTLETAFHRCAVAGNNDILNEMLGHMSQTEVQKALNRQTAVGWTPLLIACHHGHMEMVTTLLGNHARVDVFDNEGRSALHLAADRGYLQVPAIPLYPFLLFTADEGETRYGVMLECKGGINRRSRENSLTSSIVRHDSHMQKSWSDLAENQIRVNRQLCVYVIQVCDALLTNKAFINSKSRVGRTALHLAAMNGYAYLVRYTPVPECQTSSERSDEWKGNLRLRVSSSEECDWQAGLLD
ncbi:hypothetical protein PR048_002377 [Dryococelus australis]|uniref:Ankyrin repeat protein n=1 Tax=Dryococelus australis TaxID=614101 RepID=A0ABQ9IK10_9NEOP|nr:hypothetical protein PR048_002377 [Dryococelus australis]